MFILGDEGTSEELVLVIGRTEVATSQIGVLHSDGTPADVGRRTIRNDRALVIVTSGSQGGPVQQSHLSARESGGVTELWVDGLELLSRQVNEATGEVDTELLSDLLSVVTRAASSGVDDDNRVVIVRNEVRLFPFPTKGLDLAD